jgi:hypothetical protein
MRSHSYQARLLEKLTALLASIDVALARVRATLQRQQGDPRQLQDILANLVKTRVICEKARAVIAERLAARLKRDAGAARAGHLSYREYVEFSSVGEIAKFRELGSISRDEIGSCDVDQLMKRLLG